MRVLVLVVFVFCISYVTNLVLCLQDFNEFTYLLTYLLTYTLPRAANLHKLKTGRLGSKMGEIVSFCLQEQ